MDKDGGKEKKEKRGGVLRIPSRENSDQVKRKGARERERKRECVCACLRRGEGERA